MKALQSPLRERDDHAHQDDVRRYHWERLDALDVAPPAPISPWACGPDRRAAVGLRRPSCPRSARLRRAWHRVHGTTHPSALQVHSWRRVAALQPVRRRVRVARRRGRCRVARVASVASAVARLLHAESLAKTVPTKAGPSVAATFAALATLVKAVPTKAGPSVAATFAALAAGPLPALAVSTAGAAARAVRLRAPRMAMAMAALLRIAALSRMRPVSGETQAQLVVQSRPGRPRVEAM
jgi:hypothetical protein